MSMEAKRDVIAWRGRAPIWLGLVAIAGLSWAYLARMQAGMSAMTPPMAAPAPSLTSQLATAFAMWTIMMIAMMVPTSVQSLSVFTAMSAKRRRGGSLTAASAFFVLGYIAAWTGYSVLAAAVQVGLSRAAFLTPMLQSASIALSALILLGAGLFQFSTLKEACLTKCRTPLAFFLAEWRDGNSGAFVMGMRHGGYCVGCCWALMAVMLVVGAMNLLWMAALAVFMLAEKLAPVNWPLSRVVGVAFLMWGAFVAADLFG